MAGAGRDSAPNFNLKSFENIAADVFVLQHRIEAGPLAVPELSTQPVQLIHGNGGCHSCSP